MAWSRWTTALVGLALSLALSAALYYYFDTLFAFVFLPFVPFLLRGGSGDDSEPETRTCPACGFETRSPDYDYCPRDGTALE